jgi:hypothetical protein
MEGVKNILETFYNDNKSNELIISRNEIISIMNSSFSISPFFTQAKEIRNLIKENDMIFGIKDYIIFTESKFLICKLGYGNSEIFDIKYFLDLDGCPKTLWKTGNITMKGREVTKVKTMKNDFFSTCENLKLIISNYIKYLDNIKRIEIETRNENNRIEEENRIKKLTVEQNLVLQNFDKDGNGEVDIISGNDFTTLLKKHQNKIIELDKNYIQKFVKVSSYIKTKKENIQIIYNSISNTKHQKELEDYVGILKNEIHNYNLILYSSLSMITSLVNEDMITFYEIYESFDKLNMFNSNWENEISQKLTNIGDGINNLMYAIQDMGDSIVNELGNLSFLTEELNNSLTTQLNDVESAINTNNLLTGIQTYQLYKINKNTRNLRE